MTIGARRVGARCVEIDPTPLKPISRTRFDAIAGYARGPLAHIAGEELAYYEHGDGSIVGMIIMDREDEDFAGLVFAPDARLRYRCADMTKFGPRRRAEAALRRAMEAAYQAPAEAHHQGDEVGEPIDFFKVMKPNKQQNPNFVGLATMHGYLPARRIIEPMMRWYEDADGNFVEQFQTAGFDQRIWELYLFAAFTQIGYVLDRRHPVPDYMLRGPYGAIAVEAVTVAPSQAGELAEPPSLDTDEGRLAYLEEYMPIKFGSALFSKLRKKYWEQGKVAGKPLVFAIEDFSSPGSMSFTRSALPRYLYGLAYDTQHDETGRLVITPRKLNEHRWGKKVIPSGFFNLEDAKHVSAVLFSNSGTVAKFNRMGVLAGFCPDDVVLVRHGTRPNLGPDASEPLFFQEVVNAPGYTEDWSEGLEVYHNPSAAIPLDHRALPGAAHHALQPDGRIITTAASPAPMGSQTLILTPTTLAQVMTALRSGHL